MNEHPLRDITENDITAYERDGAVCLRGMMDAGWIEHLRHAVGVARARPGPFFQDHTVKGEATGFFSDLHMSLRVPEFLAFAKRSPVAAIAGTLMRSTRVNLLHDGGVRSIPHPSCPAGTPRRRARRP
jgi:hypothetical protein